jgi:hypothetical protein
MNIQTCSSLDEYDQEQASEDENEEESERNLYFRGNNYKQNRKKIIEAANGLENADDSLSSTER